MQALLHSLFSYRIPPPFCAYLINIFIIVALRASVKEKDSIVLGNAQKKEKKNHLPPAQFLLQRAHILIYKDNRDKDNRWIKNRKGNTMKWGDGTG